MWIGFLRKTKGGHEQGLVNGWGFDGQRGGETTVHVKRA